MQVFYTCKIQNNLVGCIHNKVTDIENKGSSCLKSEIRQCDLS